MSMGICTSITSHIMGNAFLRNGETGVCMCVPVCVMKIKREMDKNVY